MAFQPVRRDVKWTESGQRTLHFNRSFLTIAGHAEICWIDNFISGRIRQYSFGMYAGLVCECTEAGNIIVEGDIDLDSTGDQVLDELQLGKIILAPHIVSISNQHACNESS